MLIRSAVMDDSQFVEDTMNEALSPFYGGDHSAHAKRIFQTHISGGIDRLGFFSTEQSMFILEDGGRRIAMLHLVGKRQGTYKISPLIVVKDVRGKAGYGSRLLQFAENYARDHQAHQIYCTVAEENQAAFNFFRKNGFIVAGNSFSHYKEDINEIMLYKPLINEEEELELERTHISIETAKAEHYESIAKLLLNLLPQHFSGIDPQWVDSLFSGYERRESRDINTKFKVIYVATDRSGLVTGVAAATPKKGMPIKVMPLIAVDLPAFIALVAEMPYLLSGYGHKLYIHMVPSPNECIVLQRNGWQLDAAMPAAYHAGIVTQQWSMDLDETTTMKIMRVKQKYLDLIATGRKTVEVRVAYPSVTAIRKGERIRLMSHDRSEIIRIEDVRHYSNFESMLLHERAESIVPGKTETEVLILLREIYPQDREALGVVAIEVLAESKPGYTTDKRPMKE